MIERRPQRVLLTGDTAGGVWTYVNELAEALIKRDVNVCLATFGPSPSVSQEADAASVCGLDWHHLTSRLEWMTDPWDDLRRAGEWLQDLCRFVQPELIHLNTLSHGELDWGVPVVTTVHSCVCSWWSAVKQSPLPSEWRDYRQAVEKSLRSTNLIVAPTSSLLRSVLRHYALHDVESTVVFNGRSGQRFHESTKQPILLTVGRVWDEAKNLQALANLAPDLPWPVYVAGETTSPDGIAAGSRGYQPLGMLSPADLATWYGLASIYAAPAKYEPFGLAVLEAALSGCALVLSDIPSFREIWSDAALFCEAGDKRALESSIRALIDDAKIRESMGQRAKARAMQFTQSRMVEGYLGAYTKAMANYHAYERSHACAS